MASAVLSDKVARRGQKAHPAPATEQGTYELVSRTTLADGAYNHMTIRSASGSEVTLGPWWLTAVGDCMTSARFAMADDTYWEVDKSGSDYVEASFRRDAEVAVGQPFSILVCSSSEHRRLRISLGRVAAIHVYRCNGASK